MADTSLNENRIGLLIWQTSNLWQSKLRNKLSKYNISLNEYLIIETVYNLSNVSNNISQIDIVYNSFIDKSVVSAKLSQLAKKKLIKKMTSNDNRSNRLILTKEGINIIESIIDEITSTEKIFFGRLNEETFNFINSLKLLLGKKIRIKANYNE
jgi:DNA-binding MarR family transcriptional regulator